MKDFLNSWGISLMVFLPLVGALAMLVVPKAKEQFHKVVALAASLVVGFIGILIMTNFDYDANGQLQFVVDKAWIPIINSRYIVGIDGISLPMIALTLLIVPLCIIYSWNHFPEPKNPKAFLILILILETGMLGSFVAQDLILFFVFFEVVLLPMYFMIGVWGGEKRQYASLKFFLYTLFGSALMIVAFLSLYFLSDKIPVNGEMMHSFDMRLLPELATGISTGAALWIFGGMFMGFGIKVPMFPFHTWLPDAHTQAPTVGSVILAAVLLKLGTYGFIRIAIPILPGAAEKWAPFIGLLAVIGIIYGALCCLVADRHEATHRVLIGFAYGFCDAWYRHAHHLRFPSRNFRHGCSRPHHRHALLRRWFNQGPLPHPRHLTTGRHAQVDAAYGLDPRLLGHGLSRASRSCRFLGRVPCDPVGL